MTIRFCFNRRLARHSAVVVLTAVAVHANLSQAADPLPAPAAQCLAEIKTFDQQIQKEGYWLHGSGYGVGYPMFGYGWGGDYGGYRESATPVAESAGYWRARPGYEVRTLLTAAGILASRGDQAACSGVMDSVKLVYASYAADLRNGKAPRADVSSWRQRQIAAAVTVTGNDAPFRSDQLVGAEVVNPGGESLGSVQDIVVSPADGRIAYLVIGRGGIFGIDENYVPVPWADFKTAPGAKLLVLATTKATLQAAPRVKEDQFAARGGFSAESQKVAQYWGAHLTP
jgi:sporulation protein YlmC with PRC-barrel domain